MVVWRWKGDRRGPQGFRGIVLRRNGRGCIGIKMRLCGIHARRGGSWRMGGGWKGGLLSEWEGMNASNERTKRHHVKSRNNRVTILMNTTVQSRNHAWFCRMYVTISSQSLVDHISLRLKKNASHKSIIHRDPQNPHPHPHHREALHPYPHRVCW